MIRIINAIRMFYMAFKNPEVFYGGNFQMCAELLKMIFAVSKEQHPRMTHIAYIHPTDGKEEKLVSIWAGAGVSASPTERIRELLEENRRLEMLLREAKLNKEKI